MALGVQIFKQIRVTMRENPCLKHRNSSGFMSSTPHCWLMHCCSLFYKHYRISLVIRQSFSFKNNPKNRDPSHKMDLDLCNCLGRVKFIL